MHRHHIKRSELKKTAFLSRKERIAKVREVDKLQAWPQHWNAGLKEISERFGINIKKEIEKKHAGRVLDIGCGGGRTLYELAHSFPNAELHGTSLHAFNRYWDSYNGKLRNKIRFHANVSGINLQKTFRPNYFDFIYSSLGLYNETELNKAVHQARRILARGKYLLFDCLCDYLEYLDLKGFKRLGELKHDQDIVLYLQKI